MSALQAAQIALELGAYYSNGVWRFPTLEAKQAFDRRTAGFKS